MTLMKLSPLSMPAFLHAVWAGPAAEDSAVFGGSTAPPLQQPAAARSVMLSTPPSDGCLGTCRQSVARVANVSRDVANMSRTCRGPSRRRRGRVAVCRAAVAVCRATVTGGSPPVAPPSRSVAPPSLARVAARHAAVAVRLNISVGSSTLITLLCCCHRMSGSSVPIEHSMRIDVLSPMLSARFT